MTTTKSRAEDLAEQLDDDAHWAESEGKAEWFNACAAELRRLASVEAERDRLNRLLDEAVTRNDQMTDWFKSAQQKAARAMEARDRLASECEALRKDAERYRWLRDTLHASVGGGVEVNDRRLVYEDPEPGEAVRVFWYPNTPVGFNQSTADTLDKAIDAAREAQP
jgi:chromosome segregation ATPase